MKHFVLVYVLLLSVVFGFSQNYAEDEENSAEQQQLINNQTQEQNPTNFFLGIDNSQNPRLSTLQGNSLFLTQVGEYNNVQVSTDTNSSEINLYQYGSLNDVNLDYTANNVITNVLQNGNNNQVKDFVYDKNKDVNLELVQEGNNMYFERFGANNISSSLKFKQTEASPTVIIRSFK